MVRVCSPISYIKYAKIIGQASQAIPHISLASLLTRQVFLKSHDFRILLSQSVHNGKIRVANEFLQSTGHYLCGHRVVGELFLFQYFSILSTLLIRISIDLRLLHFDHQ